MIKVVTKALGGGSDNGDKPKKKPPEPKNADEAKAMFASVFG